MVKVALGKNRSKMVKAPEPLETLPPPYVKESALQQQKRKVELDTPGRGVMA